MSDSLPTRARALADEQMIEVGRWFVEARELLRSLADESDRYREALEHIAGVTWGVHGQACDLARVALATGEQTRVVEAEEERGEDAH